MGLKRKVVVLKRSVFQSGVGFLIRWFLDHGLCHLVDFKGERDPLQQNRLQGQSQFWFIISKTSCNFLVEFVSSFSFKMKSVHCKVHSIILLTTSIWDVVSTNGSMGHWKLNFMDAATTTFQLWVIFWVIFHYRHCFVSFFINQTTKIKNQSYQSIKSKNVS